jgi:hypothetical protein
MLSTTVSFHIRPPSRKPEATKKVAVRPCLLSRGIANSALSAYPSSNVMTTARFGRRPSRRNRSAWLNPKTRKFRARKPHKPSNRDAYISPGKIGSGCGKTRWKIKIDSLDPARRSPSDVTARTAASIMLAPPLGKCSLLPRKDLPPTAPEHG